jgi:hypothetical protein
MSQLRSLDIHEGHLHILTISSMVQSMYPCIIHTLLEKRLVHKV